MLPARARLDSSFVRGLSSNKCDFFMCIRQGMPKKRQPNCWTQKEEPIYENDYSIRDWAINYASDFFFSFSCGFYSFIFCFCCSPVFIIKFKCFVHQCLWAAYFVCVCLCEIFHKPSILHILNICDVACKHQSRSTIALHISSMRNLHLLHRQSRTKKSNKTKTYANKYVCLKLNGTQTEQNVLRRWRLHRETDCEQNGFYDLVLNNIMGFSSGTLPHRPFSSTHTHKEYINRQLNGTISLHLLLAAFPLLFYKQLWFGCAKSCYFFWFDYYFFHSKHNFFQFGFSHRETTSRRWNICQTIEYIRDDKANTFRFAICCYFYSLYIRRWRRK